jgi:hypothetical protein
VRTREAIANQAAQGAARAVGRVAGEGLAMFTDIDPKGDEIGQLAEVLGEPREVTPERAGGAVVAAGRNEELQLVADLLGALAPVVDARVGRVRGSGARGGSHAAPGAAQTAAQGGGADVVRERGGEPRLDGREAGARLA